MPGKGCHTEPRRSMMQRADAHASSASMTALWKVAKQKRDTKYCVSTIYALRRDTILCVSLLLRICS
jgi:hypothetical protein